MSSTTALLRRIERENAEAAQTERDERLEAAREGRDRTRPPKWAVDHMLAVGAISPEWHTAAKLHAKHCEALEPHGMSGVSFERVDSGMVDPHFLARFRAESVDNAVRVRSMVLRSVKSKPVKRTYLALFAYPQPSMKIVRGENGGADTERRCIAAIEAVAVVVDELGLTITPKIGIVSSR